MHSTLAPGRFGQTYEFGAGALGIADGFCEGGAGEVPVTAEIRAFRVDSRHRPLAAGGAGGLGGDQAHRRKVILVHVAHDLVLGVDQAGRAVGGEKQVGRIDPVDIAEAGDPMGPLDL